MVAFIYERSDEDTGRVSQSWEWSWNPSQMPSTHLISCHQCCQTSRLSPYFVSDFPCSKWPLGFPSCLTPLPLPHPMDELWFSVMATGPPVGGNGHAKGPGSLPPCPLDIFVTSLPASFIQCLQLPLSRTGSWVQLCVLLCSFEGGGAEEHHRSWLGARRAGGTAYRYCQEPSESETSPRIRTRQWNEHPGCGRLI